MVSVALAHRGLDRDLALALYRRLTEHLDHEDVYCYAAKPMTTDQEAETFFRDAQRIVLLIGPDFEQSPHTIRESGIALSQPNENHYCSRALVLLHSDGRCPSLLANARKLPVLPADAHLAYKALRKVVQEILSSITQPTDGLFPKLNRGSTGPLDIISRYFAAPDTVRDDPDAPLAGVRATVALLGICEQTQRAAKMAGLLKELSNVAGRARESSASRQVFDILGATRKAAERMLRESLVSSRENTDVAGRPHLCPDNGQLIGRLQRYIARHRFAYGSVLGLPQYLETIFLPEAGLHPSAIDDRRCRIQLIAIATLSDQLADSMQELPLAHKSAKEMLAPPAPASGNPIVAALNSIAEANEPHLARSAF